MKIIFLDGDKLNCNIENLMMVSNKQLAYSIHKNIKYMQPEIKQSFMVLAKLATNINDIQKSIK
jgi:hypothetical protein